MHLEMKKNGICPHCGDDCGRDEVDVGVGMVYGPYGCHCGWSEWEEYDQLSKTGGGGWQEDGGYTDTKGGYWPKDNLVTKFMKAHEDDPRNPTPLQSN